MAQDYAISNVAPSPDGGGIEQRGAQRYTVLLRTAKLVADGREYLCVLRDVSATGVKLRLFHPLPNAAQFELELNSGERFGVKPVWTEGDHAGLRFCGAVAVQQFLDEGAGTQPRRNIRLNISQPALMRVRGQVLRVELCNLSAHGAGIGSALQLLHFEPVRIEVDGLPVLHGKVCWCRHPRYGVVFDFGFRLEQLAAHVAQLQGLTGLDCGPLVAPLG